MVKGIRQTDSALLPEIRKYGCLFLCFANASPLIFEGEAGRKALNKIWQEAVKGGCISGDLNGDGDVDDAGEAEVLDHTALAQRHFAMCVRYDGQHREASLPVPAGVEAVFGKYVYKSPHFVQLDKSKKVVFDPMGTSNTVLNGKLESMRWYYAG